MFRSVRTWLRTHPRLVDGAAVAPLILASPALPPEPLGASSRYVVAALAVGLCAPAVVRRQRPVGAFVVTALVAFAQRLLDVQVMPADLVLFAALYNVASRCRTHVAAAAAAVLELGAILVIWRWITPSLSGLQWWNFAFSSTLVASMWIWGYSVRTRLGVCVPPAPSVRVQGLPLGFVVVCRSSWLLHRRSTRYRTTAESGFPR